MKYGILATFALLILYAVAMTILSGWDAAVRQFVSLWFLYVPLSLGFGIQVGLFSRLRTHTGSLASGGTSATVGMLACCAHHTSDVLPFLGLAGLSIFLVQYQKLILLTSLGVNATGIYVMLRHLKKVVV